jgi:hypothetical protein
MKIDNCQHEWDYTKNEYLPIIESIKKHHACKDCGLINNLPQDSQMKTGKLIALIKELFEKNGIPRSSIRDHAEDIKNMKRQGYDDRSIIHQVMFEVTHRCTQIDLNTGDLR